MFAIYLCLTTQHDWRLAAVALAVCAAACGAALFLYSRTPSQPGLRRRLWLGVIGLVFGMGVWTTHFVAMLAFRSGFPDGYAALGTFGSMAVAVASSATGFALAAPGGSGPAPATRRALGGLVVGLGVSAMHFLSMSAYRIMGSLVWRVDFVTAAVVIGAVLSAASFWIAWPGCGSVRRWLGAALLAAAVAGLHFTAMAAFWILPDPTVVVPEAVMSQTLMAACAVAVTAVLIVVAVAGALWDMVGRSRDLQRLSEALDAMPDGLAFFDAEDRLVAWNSQYARVRKGPPLVRGQTFREIVGWGLATGHYPEAQARHEAWIAERMAMRRQASGWMEMRTTAGRLLRMSDRRTADGGTITVLADVTEQREGEAALAAARDLAEEASRIKSEFLANVSHEIRTPMNGITGMSALLLMTDLSPQQKHYVQIAQRSADELMATISDILDIAKLEAGAVEMAATPFRLEALLQEVEVELAPAAAGKGLALHFVRDGQDWPALVGDPARVRQMLSRLVSNAVKFTDAGQVRTEVRRRAEEGGRTWMRIEVADTGIGVAPEIRAKLFEPFRQADGSTTRRYGGAGLGLAICRHAVRLMGGDIGVTDRPGGGSVFWFELSLPNAPAEAGGRAEAA